MQTPRLVEDACFGINYKMDKPTKILIHVSTLDEIRPDAFVRLTRNPGEALCNRRLQLMNDPCYHPDDSTDRCQRCLEIVERQGWTVQK